MCQRCEKISPQESSLVYRVPGDPIPLLGSRIGLSNRIYDTQKKLKLIWGVTVTGQHGNNKFYKGPLHLSVIFKIKLPKNYTNLTKHRLSGCPHYCKPDVNDLVRWVEDVCAGIIFNDSSQISRITAFKTYCDEPMTEFCIKELGNE